MDNNSKNNLESFGLAGFGRLKIIDGLPVTGAGFLKIHSVSVQFGNSAGGNWHEGAL